MFPSPYGVIFILTKDIPVELQEWVRFPSPYGVSFILIQLSGEVVRVVKHDKFPSPYGVSFILIYN